MRAEVQVRPAVEDDALLLAARPRLDDMRECATVAGMAIYDAALFSLSVADQAVSGFVDGELACMFGVGRVCPLTGKRAPWLLGTRVVDRHAALFLRYSRPMFAEMIRLFPALENYVDARATRTIRWLSWIGFSIGATQPMGANSRPFVRFSAGLE